MRPNTYRTVLLAIISTLLWTTSAGAQAVGSELQINSYTTGDQSRPDVARDSLGNFVVVWHSYDQDGDGDGVFGQRYDSAGLQLGGEFQVNTYTTGDQHSPSVATADDSFLVAYFSSLALLQSTNAVRPKWAHHVTRPITATTFPLRLRLHYKAARVGGVTPYDLRSFDDASNYLNNRCKRSYWLSPRFPS